MAEVGGTATLIEELQALIDQKKKDLKLMWEVA